MKGKSSRLKNYYTYNCTQSTSKAHQSSKRQHNVMSVKQLIQLMRGNGAYIRMMDELHNRGGCHFSIND